MKQEDYDKIRQRKIKICDLIMSDHTVLKVLDTTDQYENVILYNLAFNKYAEKQYELELNTEDLVEATDYQI